MKTLDNVTIAVNPDITAKQLYAFYTANNICEKVFGESGAQKILDNSSVVVAAVENDETVIAIARAMFDGVSANIVDFCVAPEFQGHNVDIKSGGVIVEDELGLAQLMEKTLMDELIKMGSYYIEAPVIAKVEEKLYESMGFKKNDCVLSFAIDRCPK